MRLGEYLGAISSFTGSATVALKVGWLAALIVFVVGMTLTFLIGDIRGEGSLALWQKKQIPVFRAWDKFWRERKEEKLRLRKRLKEIEREDEPPDSDEP